MLLSPLQKYDIVTSRDWEAPCISIYSEVNCEQWHLYERVWTAPQNAHCPALPRITILKISVVLSLSRLFDLLSHLMSPHDLFCQSHASKEGVSRDAKTLVVLWNPRNGVPTGNFSKEVQSNGLLELSDHLWLWTTALQMCHASPKLQHQNAY